MDSQPLLVLIAEDDEDARQALGSILKAKGYRVVLALDGQHALEHLAQGVSPCAILLDWMMPRVDGETFLRARAASVSLSAIPVFVISATHVPATDVRIQGYLSKPLDIVDLQAILLRVCDTHCPPSRRERCLQIPTRD